MESTGVAKRVLGKETEGAEQYCRGGWARPEVDALIRCLGGCYTVVRDSD